MPTLRKVLARDLRRASTAGERRLWSRLRNHRLGYKFRRQAPVGPFIVDFLCPAAKLVVEIDGPTHAQTEDFDAFRTEWLEALGYRVIRFTATEAWEETDAVVDAILLALQKSAPSSPPSGTAVG